MIKNRELIENIIWGFGHSSLLELKLKKQGITLDDVRRDTKLSKFLSQTVLSSGGCISLEMISDYSHY